MNKRRLGLIGSGNMAHFLARRLVHSAMPITAIHSRNHIAGRSLAQRVGATYVEDMHSIAAQCDVIFLAVPDDQIGQLIQDIPSVNDTWLIHHSGTQSLDIFQGKFTKSGIFWPIYSINKTQLAEHRNIPIIITASDHEVQGFLLSLAQEITNLYDVMDDASRKVLHLMAVMSNNFMNHLATITKELGDEKSVAFDWVVPIIQQTTDRMKAEDVSSLQTGPAIRNDVSTMNHHLELLSNHPMWQDIYQTISQSIIEYYKKKS